jgi:uncharacterized protein (TIGR02246 family)
MTKTFTKNFIGGFLIIGLVSCNFLSDNATYDPTQAKAEILEIENTWAQVAVTGDPSVIEQIFGDDFVGVNPEGLQYTKQDFINDTKNNPLGFTSTVLNDVNLRFMGNVAIAQGSETFTQRDGKQGRFVWTDVLVRRDGKWQIIAAEDIVVDMANQTATAPLFQSPDQSTETKREIDNTRNAYVSAWQSGNATRISGLYTADALVLYPDMPAISGTSDINSYFKSFFDDFPKNEFELTSAEIVVTGPWAFDRGTYRWRGFPHNGGKPGEDNGKYLVILQRQADGLWKVARDMDNSDRPATQTTREKNLNQNN